MAKILIIDDEERNRRLFEVFAKADGHSIIFATGGKMGTEVAARDIPDLILLDLMMPGMDGFEVTRTLKANPVTRNIPIIVVSSLDDIASRQRMSAAGIDEFLVKPVDRWELSQRISKLLRSPELPNNGGGPNGAGDETGNG
jgi:putative two-component system response regulator